MGMVPPAEQEKKKEIMEGYTHGMATDLGFIDEGEPNVEPIPISWTCPNYILEQEQRLNVPPHQFQEHLPTICRVEWKEGSIYPNRLTDTTYTGLK